MGHTVTARTSHGGELGSPPVSSCEASVRLEGFRSGEQLRKTRERRKQEPNSRGLGITVLPGR
ncbi:Mobile element protein [Geitlerinema sp. FC II]|nr:Mobile element protein [Geitlerinema sp. FC II]